MITLKKLLCKNIDYQPYKKPSLWRKMSLGTWRPCGDPSVYGMVEVDATNLLKVIEDYKKQGINVTPTSIVAKSIAMSLKAYPWPNSVIRFGRFYLRKNIDIFLQVGVSESGNVQEDLSGVVIRDCDQKNLLQIANELAAKAKPIKLGNDVNYKQVKSTMSFIPGFLLWPLFNIISFILHDLNIYSKLFGMPQNSFGSAMVTSVSSFGVEKAFAPLIPYARTSMLVVVGKIMQKAVVENNAIVIRPIMSLGVTMDHRFIDGTGGGKMLKALTDFLNDPK